MKALVAEKDEIISQQVTQTPEVKRVPKPDQKLHLETQESIVEIKSGERRACPECGAVGIDIKTFEDRDKVLDYLDHKPIYARKYTCRKCGCEF